jgi:hypothetical protein
MPRARFVSAIWQQLYHWIHSQDGKDPDRAIFLRYMREKSAGYREGQLLPAFPTLAKV